MPDPKTYDRLLDESLGPADPTASSSMAARYESLFADEDRRTEAALRVIDSRATQTPADQAAEAARIAKRLGLPVDTVQRNLPAMRERARVADTDYARMLRESPVLSTWLTEDNNAQVAQDELPQLGALERSMRFGRRAAGAFGSGVMGMSRGFWGLVQAGAEAAPAGLGMVPGEGWARLADFAKETAGDVATMQVGMRGDVHDVGAIESGVLGGVESLGTMAAAVPLLFVPGGQGVAAAAFAGGMGAGTAGNAYSDARAAGLAPNQALVYAYGQGGVEILTELIPAKWLLGDLAKNAGLGRMLLHQIGAELPGEQVATLFQDLNEWAVLNPDKPFSAYVNERPSAAAQTLISTIVAVGGHTTAVRVLDRALNDGKTPTQRTLEEAGAALAGAPTTASTPEKVQALIGRMAPPGSKIDTVYLPVETFVSYFQDRQINPATIAEALTGSKTALAEAVALGTELSIPTAAYLEVLGKTEHNAYFAREARFDPDELNAREEDAAVATEGGKALAADLSPQDAQAPNVEAIRSTVRDQLLEAGIDRRTADQYAGLHASAFGTLATRAGIDPEVLFDRYRLAITRELGPQTGAAASTQKARTVSTLDLARAIEQTRARRGESPTDQPILGDVGAPPGQEVPEGTGESQTTGAELAGGGVEPGAGGPAQPSGGAGAESVPASGGRADRPGLPAPGGVSRSVPRPGETASGRLRRRSKHYSALVRSLLTAARRVDPIANLAAVRRELTFRVEAFEERQQAYLESGQDPLDLLRTIASVGGINTVDFSYPGEIRWLKSGLRFGQVAGVPGVFTAGGQSIDDIVTSLQQDQRFAWVDSIDTLIDALDDAVRHPVSQEEDRFPGTDDLQDDLKIDPETAWWKNQWMPEGQAEGALGLDEDLLGDAVELEGGDLDFDPAALEGTPFEELNQGPRMMTLEEVLGADVPAFEVEGQAELPEEATARQAPARGVDAAARLQTLAPRPDVSPDSRAVPFEAIPDAYGTTLFRARDVATTYQARLPIDRLIATQATVSEREVVRKLEERAAGQVPKLVDVLEHAGRYYIADGTHTSTAAWAAGDRAVSGRVTKVRPDWLEAPPPYRSALDPVPPPALAIVAANPEELYQEGRLEAPEPAAGVTLAQPDRRGGERGVIRIGADRTMSIALFASADLSTFLHESGHFFLEVFHDTAQALQTLDPATLTLSQRKLLADYGAALQYLGAESFADLTVEQKETWARGFEAYLFEGKAPSAELRSSFFRFGAWLRGIYRSLRALRVELTPEVRGVFDRLLATDAAITAAQAEARLGPLFLTQEAAGMTAEEWEAYQGGIAKAREAAETALRVELLADYQRARQDWWKEERARVRAEVAQQRGQDQVYVAMSAIRTGLRPDGTPFIPGAPVAPLKLNKRELERLVPGATKKLPRPFLYTTEGGIHPDDAAELLAYDNGQALVEALILSDPFDKVVDQQTDDLMAEKYGDRLAAGQLEALAKDAVESHDQAELLEAEQRALARKRREVAPFVQAEAAKGERALDELEREREYERRWLEAEARLRLAIAEGRKQAEIDELRRRAEVDKAALRQGARAVAASVPSVTALRAIAEARVSQTKVGDLKPQTFWNAARRAGTQAIDAAARQSWDAAIEAKGRQRLNLELYRAAQNAVDQVEEAREEAKALFKADATLAKSRNLDYVALARVLAARYFFPTRQESALEAIERIRTYDPDLYQNFEAQIAGAMAGAGDLKSLTVENFIGVKDTIAALWALSRRDKQVAVEGKLLEREAVMGELAARLQAVGLPTDRPGYTQAATKWEQSRMYLMGARSALRRVEHWVDAVDQGKPDGPFRRYVWQPVSEAAARYRQAKVGVLQTYLEIVKGVEATIVPGQIAAPEIGYTFSGRAELLHALLHTGNASNLQKLLRGRKWGDYRGEGDAQVLDTSRWDKFVERAQREGLLTAADYTYAQATWDLLETLKAPAQKAHHAMYGSYFSEIVAVPLVTPFGTFRGGYVPAIADPFLAPDAATKAEKASLTEGQNSFMFPTTGRGFTKARTEAYAKPLALNLALIPQHIDKVLRFVHLEPVVKDVARMVFDPSFRATLDAFDPTVGGDLLVPWLQRSASQRVQTPSQGWGGRAADTFFRGVRTRVGLNIMTANVVNTLQQFTGFALSATQVKKRYLVRALWRYVRSPRQFAEEAARDPWMATRVSASVMEVSQTIDDLLLNPNKYDQARAFAARHGYFAQAAAQNLIDLVTYGGAYEQAIEERGVDETEARRAGGAAVRMTQGSFAPEDVSRFETGSPFMRAFSMFFSYFNNQANLLGSKFAIIVRDDVGLRKGAGRALYLYTFGFMVPAVLGEVLRQAVVGFEDDDDESYLDEVLALFFGSQFRGLTSFVPIIGPAVQATINAFNDKGWDDRITTSPAVSTLEQSARAPSSVYDAIVEGRGYKKAIRDALTLVGLMTGLPVAPLGKPLGYAADVAEGRANPEGPLELTQGLVSGRSPSR